MKGFTLIELMVSVAIMGVMVGGGVFYMNRVNSLQKIDSAREELISNLREARNLAITNQKPIGFTDLVTEIYVDLKPNGLLEVKPNSVTEEIKYSSKNIADVNIDIGITNGPIRFEMYTGKLMGSGSIEIIISSKELTSAEDKVISINSSGLIDDK